MESDSHDLGRRVRNFLATRHFAALRRLEVDAEGGIVVVRGRVSTFHEKQVAIHCCRRVAGVIQLIDEVVVA